MDSEEKQSGKEPENLRIECKSKRSISLLFEKLKEKTSKYEINSATNYSSDPLLRNLFQTYKRAFLSNILVDGQTVDNTEDGDTTSEFEPLDTEKEKYIQHELMNKFDEQIVTTTQLRKTGPHLLRSHMKKMIRPELKHLTLVNVVPNSSSNTDQPEITVVEESAREDIETRLHSTAQTLESTKQDCEEMLVKSKDLLQALKQYKRTEHSNVDQVLFETPPSTPLSTSQSKNTSIKCEIRKNLLL